MRTSCKIFSLAFLLVLESLAAASAATIGMVADNVTHSVTVFDADSGTVLGTVVIPPTGTIGDCAVTADQTRGFVTDFAHHVWVIDLTTSPPSLAGGTNPIPISNPGEDTVITPDNKFLVTCDGAATGAISVIDIATQTEIGTFILGTGCNSVDICRDNSVLVTSFGAGNVRRLTISPGGVLSDTGETMPATFPNNVYCAPGSASGVVITGLARQIRSFTIPGLAPVDTRTLAGTLGISGAINPTGDHVFVRSQNGDFGSPGFMEAFDYNTATGAIGAAPFLTIPITGTSLFFGMDQMALHPDGSRLYISEPSAVKVFATATGAPLPPITDPSIALPTGLAFRSGAATPEVTALSDAHLWVGLRNSDDQGTQFDLKTELLKNGAPVAAGLKRCITGLTRNPLFAKEGIVPWNAFSGVPVTSGDVLGLRVSTRIGTNPDGTKCAGPGGSHNNAVGLRLYYDSAGYASRFDVTISPNPSEDLYLHSDGSPCHDNNGESSGVTTRFLDTVAPTATFANKKCKDSGPINFNGGNPFSVVGTLSLAPLP